MSEIQTWQELTIKQEEVLTNILSSVQEGGKIIHFNGPAGIGKNVIARKVSEKLGFHYISVENLGSDLEMGRLVGQMKECEKYVVLHVDFSGGGFPVGRIGSVLMNIPPRSVMISSNVDQELHMSDGDICFVMTKEELFGLNLSQ